MINNPKLRHELKYPINVLQHQVLRKKLAIILKPDPHMKSSSHYNVKNLYFDDIADSALCEKEAGIFKRKKYRIRIYNHSDQFIKFERKTKISQFMLKESVRINRSQADRIITCDIDFLAKSEHKLLRDFYAETRCRLMHPVVIVEYDREAFLHPIGNVRITFDSGLRMGIGSKSFFDFGSTMDVIDQQGIILEVKYNEVLPQFIRGLFPDTIPPQKAIGKYVLCRNQQLCQTKNTLVKFSGGLDEKLNLVALNVHDAIVEKLKKK